MLFFTTLIPTYFVYIKKTEAKSDQLILNMLLLHLCSLSAKRFQDKLYQSEPSSDEHHNLFSQSAIARILAHLILPQIQPEEMVHKKGHLNN
jgi:hypothetical protein